MYVPRRSEVYFKKLFTYGSLKPTIQFLCHIIINMESEYTLLNSCRSRET